MANNDEITSVQSFTERTLKYGRNMMAAAVPIIVFYFVPLVDLARSRPFNFEIKEGGELWIWVILLALLVYYGFRFIGLAIPDFSEWRNSYGLEKAKMKGNLNRLINEENSHITDIEKYRGAFDNETTQSEQETLQTRIGTVENNLKECQNGIRSTRSEISIYKWRRANFWLADAGFPTVLFGLALWASLDKVYALLCDLQLCQSLPRFVALVCLSDMPSLFQ